MAAHAVWGLILARQVDALIKSDRVEAPKQRTLRGACFLEAGQESKTRVECKPDMDSPSGPSEACDGFFDFFGAFCSAARAACGAWRSIDLPAYARDARSYLW